MRKVFILLLAVIFSLDMMAQLEVKEGSFKEVKGFVNINPDQNYQTDDNDLPFSVIKVRTENITDKQRRELKFNGNAGTFIMLEYKDGEVWVYLTAQYASYLKISHHDFSSVEFTLPFDLTPKQGYEMTLVNKSPKLDKNNYLIIKVDQTDAKIYIDDEFIGTGYASKIVSIAEEHRYKVVCDDYFPKEGLVYFDKLEDKEIKVVLEPNFGYITINSEPNGAEVYIDENKVGITPYKVKKIKPGQHSIELRKYGYVSLVDIITIKTGDHNKRFENVKLEEDININKQTLYPINNEEYAKPTVSIANNGNKIFTVNGVSFEMVYVKGGMFTMGCTSEQGNRCNDNEKPTHNVILGNYYIGKFEVTQDLWKAVMGNNPSFFKGDNLPVDCVNWNNCQEFIRKLNQLTGLKFHLPTEAEWEYAARGGINSNGYKYSGSNNIDDVAWYYENGGNTTHPVGMKKPNELNIYDMTGNVLEWCLDWQDDYKAEDQLNPQGSSSGIYKIHRGGSWGYKELFCRIAKRGIEIPNYYDNYFGFRLALEP